MCNATFFETVPIKFVRNVSSTKLPNGSNGTTRSVTLTGFCQIQFLTFGGLIRSDSSEITVCNSNKREHFELLGSVKNWDAVI